MLSTPSFSHPGRSTDCSNKEVTTRFPSLINEGRLFVKLLACSTMGGPTIEIAIQIKPTNKAKIIVILPHIGTFHFSKSNGRGLDMYNNKPQIKIGIKIVLPIIIRGENIHFTSTRNLIIIKSNNKPILNWNQVFFVINSPIFLIK